MSDARALVVIDYQNIHLTGHDCFVPKGVPKHESLIHPLTFASLVVQKRQAIAGRNAMAGKTAPPSPRATLASVKVYRGAPSNLHAPIPYARSQAQRSEWTRDKRVEVVYRPLKYYSDGSAREKGVDVLVAINLVEAVRSGDYSVVILAAHDTDQEPALESALTISQENGVALETAGWEGSKVLKARGKRLWHTSLNGAEFVTARDRRNYD